MKTLMTAAAATATFTFPVFAETTAEEYFAMSNESAAETMVQETSEADFTKEELLLLLQSKSAAERQGFFEKDDASRRAEIIASRVLMPKNSPAEAAAASEG